MKQATHFSIKQALGQAAAEMVQDGMVVGLGTGSTATCFIESLIKRCQSELKIGAVATSDASYTLAKQGGIPILSNDQVIRLDLTVDGADEIDPQNRMIKGGGGALVREKILASTSKQMLVLVDESKLVSELGAFTLPVEIIPFCYLATLARIREAGFDGKMRYHKDGSHYLTDNGNFIFDVHTPKTFPDPAAAHQKLTALAGVVETGLFYNLPVQVLVGYQDGHIEMRKG